VKPLAADRIVSVIFGISAVLAVFTGFGNMPLYRRYYIADLPGFGWSGDFFVNLHVHYVAGSVLLAVAVYGALRFWRERKAGARLTRSGIVRAAVLALALASGLFMALRNLPGIDYPLYAHAGLNFLHMGVAVVFMLVGIACAAARCRWLLRPNQI
jgi:hypothetical protein